MGFHISINRSLATDRTLSAVRNMDDDSMRLIRNNVKNASDQEIPTVITLAFEKLLQSAPKILRRRVPSFQLQNIVGGLCDLLATPDDYDELPDEYENGRISRMSVDRRAKRTGCPDISRLDKSVSLIPLSADTPPSARTPATGLLPSFKELFNRYDSDSGSMSISSINSRASTAEAESELAVVSKKVADVLMERPETDTFWDKLSNTRAADLLCSESPTLCSPPATPLTEIVPTMQAPSSPSSTVQSWLNRTNLDSRRGTSPLFLPPLIDENYETDHPPMKRIDFKDGNFEATLFMACPAPPPPPLLAIGDTPMDLPGGDDDDDDLTAYMEFDATDYIILPDEMLYCGICDTNVFDVNILHTLSKSHKAKLNAAPASTKHKVWQITAGGSLRCNVCEEEFCIRTEHTATKSHAQAKKFKTSEVITQLELSVWGRLPSELLDEVALVRNDKAGQQFCVLCEQHLETPVQKLEHQQKSLKHRAYKQQLRTRSIFAYGFGVLQRNKGKGDSEMHYCVLCKVGITNFLEYEYHVHATDSQHTQRLRTFWTRACPKLSPVLTKYGVPTKDVSLYLPKMPPNTRNRERSIILSTIILSKRGGLKMCCLCNQFLLLDDDVSEHCRSREHVLRESQFRDSFFNVNKASGIIRRGRNTYCVLCRMGFTNRIEAQLHVDTTTHQKRVLQFAHNYYFGIVSSRFMNGRS